MAKPFEGDFFSARPGRSCWPGGLQPSSAGSGGPYTSRLARGLAGLRTRPWRPTTPERRMLYSVRRTCSTGRPVAAAMASKSVVTKRSACSSRSRASPAGGHP